MKKEELKKEIKRKLNERGWSGFANHTYLPGLMAEICEELVNKNDCIADVIKQRGLLIDFLAKYEKFCNNRELGDIDIEFIDKYIKVK